MKKKIMSILTGALLVFAQADGLIAAILPNNSVVVNRPTVNVHASGTAVVDIVAPNSKGMSHNRYDEFNVDVKGVVLNNSLTGAESEILGESIGGNANFTDRMASVILNEILSGAKSEINGAVEIAGSKAVLIMANPYGISVNGGRFINTEKTMLVTGTPNIVDETIKSFRLSRLGVVEVGGAGLVSSDAMEIVSRYTKLSGEMKAKSIEIKAGNKEYVIKEGTGEWEIISEEINENATDKYAVSAWAFGSMYGDRIKIVSTEKGFGVKTAEGANLISDVSDIEIRADGEIEIRGEIVSKRDIGISGWGKIISTGRVSAGKAGSESEAGVEGNIKIEAKEGYENRGNIKAEGKIEIEAEGMKNEGEIKGIGVRIRAGEIKNEKTGKLVTSEAMKIEGEEIRNAGLINAGRLEIEGRGAMISTGYINVRENIDIVLSGSFSNAFNILGKSILIKASKIKNESGTMKAEENISLETDVIENESGRISSGLDLGIKFNTESDFNTRGGYEAGGKLSFSGIKNFVNESELVAQAIEIKLSETFLNRSSLISLGDMIINAGLISNENGLLRAGNNLTLTGGQLINEKSSVVGNGEITGREVVIKIEGDIRNKSGKISSTGKLEISGKNITNESNKQYGQAKISGGDISIEALEIRNKSGKISSTDKLKIMADKIENKRMVSGREYLWESEISGVELLIWGESGEKASKIENENSVIRAGTKLSLKAEQIINRAAVHGNASGVNYRIKKKDNKKGETAENLYAVADYEIIGKGQIESMGEAELKAGKIDNISSVIKAAGKLDIFAREINNEAHSIKSPEGYAGEDLRGKLYASMGAGSLIGGWNVNIAGQGGVVKAGIINNEISEIRAEKELKMWAEEIRNIGVGEINLEVERGIKVRRATYKPAIEYNGSYGVMWEEIGEIEHRAKQAKISGEETRLEAGTIINESSLIEGRGRLEIEGGSLINRAIMFKDKLQVHYETRGKAKDFSASKGHHEKKEKRNYEIGEEYTFVSQTVGEIKSGGDIEIKLSGNLEQDKNSGALVRYKDGENRVIYSNITSQDNLSIEAGNIYNYGGLQSGLLMNIKTAGDYEGKDAKLIAGSLDLYAENSFINEARVEYHTYNKPKGDGEFYIKKPYVNGYGIFMVTAGDSKINARKKLTIRGIEGIVRGNSNINMKHDGIFESKAYNLEWKVKVYDRKGSGSEPNKLEGNLNVLGDSIITSEEGDLNFKGFNRETGGNEKNSAGGNHNDEPLELIERWSYTANEDKLFGSGESSSREYVKISNIGSSVKVGGKLEIIAGNNINIMAGSLESLSDIVSLVAGMNINLLAGEDYESSKTTKIKSGMLGLEMESEEREESSSKAAASVIKGAGGVKIKAGQDVNIVGSDVEGGGNSRIEAGRNINVLEFEEVDYSFYRKEKRTIDLSSALGSIGSIGEDLGKGRLKLASVKGQQSTEEREETTRSARGSNINIAGDLSMRAGESANIVGSNIKAEEIDLSAKDINILSAKESHELRTSQKEASLEISVGVTNSFVDAYNAVDGAVKATQNVAKANDELDEAYKEHKAGKISDEALQDAKTNLTLAVANEVAALTMAYASAASAAASAKTGGFNASLMIDAQVNEQSHKEKTESNKGSSLVATKGDVKLKAANNINQVGSEVVSEKGDIEYDAGNDVTIKASKDVTRTKDKNESYSASMTIGTGGLSGSLGFEQGGASSTEVSYNNAISEAKEGTVRIKSGGNATLSGANVSGKKIVGEIGGDLKVESLQDTYKSEGKQYGASVGISGGEGVKGVPGMMGGGSAGVGGVSVSGHYGQSKADVKWVNQQTTLTGSESVNISVGGKTTNVGAVIASADMSIDKDTGKISVSNDKGNLTLKTKEFEYIEIKDKDERRSYDYGGGLSLGKGDGKSSAIPSNAQSVNVTLKKDGHVTEQTTRATMGQGTIIVDGVSMTPSQLEGLNRDVTKSQEITKDQVTNQLDAQATVDLRFWGSLYGALTGAVEKDKDGNVIVDENGNPIKKELSVVTDTKTIYNSGKELLNSLGITGSKADKILNLLGKDPEKLTQKEKEMIKEILEEGKRRYLENALETGDFDPLMIEEQEKIKNNKEMRDGIERTIIDSKMAESIESNQGIFDDYLNHPGGVDIFNEKAVAERIKEAKKAEKNNLNAGNPTCNQTTTAELAKYGINLPYYDKKTGTWYKAENQIPYIRSSEMYGEITGTTKQEQHNNAYQKAVADKDRPIIVAIETKKGAWHIGVINPNAQMQESRTHGVTVPPVYTYVPNSNALGIPAHVGTAQLGRHVSPDNVVSIQYFEYNGPIITDGKDNDRFIPRNRR